MSDLWNHTNSSDLLGYAFGSLRGKAFWSVVEGQRPADSLIVPVSLISVMPAGRVWRL